MEPVDEPGNEASGGGSGRPPGWMIGALAGVGAVAVILAGVLIFGGGSDETAPAKAQANRGSAAAADGEFVTKVRRPVSRLGDSAQVTARELTLAARPGDVDRVSRMARQQLALVLAMRAEISNAPTTRDTRVAAGWLARATDSHRKYLAILARMGAQPSAQGLRALRPAQTHAQRAVDQYGEFARLVPGLTGAITSSGMTDLSGLRQALVARRAAEERAEREREAAANTPAPAAAPAPAPSSSGSSGGDPRRGPVVERISAVDAGSTIDISARYCDRTPGAVNQFSYVFTVREGGSIIASDSYTASQTRACNDISWSFTDTFRTGGTFEAVVEIQNYTNGVSGSGRTSFLVVN